MRGRKKTPIEKVKFVKHVRITPAENVLLLQMLEADDIEVSPFVRKLIREEAQRRGVAVPQPATATQAI